MLKQYEINELYAVFRNRYNREGKKKTEIAFNDLELYRQIKISDKPKAIALVNQLNQISGVAQAYIEVPFHIKPSLTPIDVDYSVQWHLNSTTKPDADIDAEAAWDINTGRNDVIIAVCDGGVDYNHPDLDPGDRSRVIAGYDAADNDNDPLDDLIPWATGSFAGHGTSVAGIIGAITNNNSQVAGVMWNCKIMPVKMVGSGGISITTPFGNIDWDFSTTAFPADVADAIDYAVNNGAHVINLSYGFESMGWPIDEIIFRIPLLYSAINNAYQNNVVIVVAMGNEFQIGNPINYPAAFGHEVIGVGGTTINSEHSPKSSAGPHINVSAPGLNIWTTERFGGIDDPSGTSMAAPIVSGVAGLIISQGLDRNFNLTNDDVRHILEITSDDITEYGIGFDEKTGHGKVNARKALELLDEPNVVIKGTSFGGNTSITNLSTWVTIIDRWGLAPGTYYNVDQYEITKHITFETPFCDIPTVWLRDRESVSMSFGSPNDGFPYAEISNVTETGFDVRYASYYVRTNSLGQTINKYIPSTPSLTKIEYTAVGTEVPTISGPTTVCATNATFTLNNRPFGATVNWTKSSNLSYVSGQGTDTYNVNAISYSANGPDWVKATISNGMDTTIQKNVYLSPSFSELEIQSPIEPINGDYDAMFWASGLPADITNYNWSVTNGNIVSQDGNEIVVSPSACIKGKKQSTIILEVTASNSCRSSFQTRTVAVDCEGGIINPLKVNPNPANYYIEAFIDYLSDEESLNNEKLHFKLYNNRSIPVYNGITQQKKFKINTSSFPDGMYYLVVQYKNQKYTTTILISH